MSLSILARNLLKKFPRSSSRKQTLERKFAQISQRTSMDLRDSARATCSSATDDLGFSKVLNGLKYRSISSSNRTMLLLDIV